jgi:glycosyltransferase involved in cell wall biosynthesis
MKERADVASQVVGVSIVVPVYRNAETLQELHRRICKVFETLQLSFEVLFVDDACPAGSLTVLESLAKSDSRVAVLVLERNAGQHRAVLAGLAHARGKWSVVMDADLQDPPEAIPDLLAKGQEGFAAVFAGRRGQYESPLRLFTSRLFKSLLHLLCGVPADAGFFVALNRPMLERLLILNGPHPSLAAMIGCAGLPLTSIPVKRSQRIGGSSAYSFRGRLTSGWRAIIWVLAWKSRFLRRMSNCNAKNVPVKSYIGARFAQTRRTNDETVVSTPP